MPDGSSSPATILGECAHNITYAFCEDCRTKSPGRIRTERAWRDRRERPVTSLIPGDDLPFVSKLAEFESRCPWCSKHVEVGDLIYKVEGEWVDEECASDWDDPSDDDDNEDGA